MHHFSLASFFIALGFFIFGLKMVQEGLTAALAKRFRFLLNNLTSNRFTSYLSGMFMTLILQSATATNVTLIGFINVSFITLFQAIPMSLGADLGTSLLVLFLASATQIDVRMIAMIILGVGFVLNFLFKSRRFLPFFRFVLGLGFVLYGLSSLSIENQALKDSKLLQEILVSLSQEPLFACLIGALLASFLQSSAVVLGLLMSLGAFGLIDLSQAIPFIAGANLGGIVTPVFASIRSGIESKRLAMLYALFKSTGVLVLFIFSPYIVELLRSQTDQIPFQIALAHIVLNASNSLIYLPLVTYAGKFSRVILKEHPKDRKFEPKYLETRALSTPLIAFANVHREILRMTEIAQEMFSLVLVPFQETSFETVEYIDDLDDHIDLLNREIKFYLAKLNQSELTDSEAKKQVELMMLTNSIEGVGDVISNDIMQLAQKMRRKGLKFSGDGWAEIQEFHQRVMDNFQLSVTCLSSGDIELGQKALKNKKLLAQYEQELGQRHLLRLHQGFRESFDTSSIHLDLLSNMRRVNSIVCKMAYPVIDRRRSP